MHEESGPLSSVPGLDLHLDRPGGRLRDGVMEAIRDAIRSGRLAPGAQLPSSRALAADLGVARNTVASAYAELIAEGWLTSQHASCTLVAQRAAESPSSFDAPPPRRWAQRHLDHDFRPGHPDLSSFPRTEWSRAVKRALNVAPFEAFGYSDPQGQPELRNALAQYLSRARGVRTRPDNILICSGAADGLKLVAGALAEGGVTAVAVEEFGLYTQWASLARAGLRCPPLTVDAHGADVMALDGMADAGGVLLTPSHQFPLGVPLHSDRRAAVVDWARRTGGLIIEDDYDGEFRYDRSPVGALQGIDPERVIYMGTASKSLAPGLRLGWLVLPHRLFDAVGRQRGEREETCSFVDQLAMAEFIVSGGYDKHIRTMRAQYRRRREQLVEAVARTSPTSSVAGMPAGLQVMLELADSDESAVCRERAWRRLGVEGLDRYRHPESGSERNGLVISFGAPAVSAWPAALEALVRLLP